MVWGLSPPDPFPSPTILSTACSPTTCGSAAASLSRDC